MLTKNYKAFLICEMTGSTVDADVYDWAGTKRSTFYSTTNDLPLFLRSLSVPTSTTAGIVFGSGTTPPTEDDYTLGNRITSGFTASASASYSDGIVDTIITITNTGSTTMTITEIGRVENLKVDSSSATKQFLLERSLLDEPLVIEPNGVGVIHYKKQIFDIA